MRPSLRFVALAGLGLALILQGCGSTMDPAGVVPEADGGISALLQALEEGDPQERLEAAEALGEEGTPVTEEVVPALEGALDDESGPVRQAALDALEGIATPAAAHALGKGLTCRHADVRQRVMAVLRRLLALLEQQEFVSDAPSEGEPPDPPLGEPDLEDGSGKPWPPRWRHRLRRLLGWVHHLERRAMDGDCEAVARLERLEHHCHLRVRRAASQALEHYRRRRCDGLFPRPMPMPLPPEGGTEPAFSILPVACGCLPDGVVTLTPEEAPVPVEPDGGIGDGP